MAEVLSSEAVKDLDEMLRRQQVAWAEQEVLARYHSGTKTLQQIGISIPPELDVLEVVVNWPRVAVEAIVERSDVKTLRRTGQLETDRDLLTLFDANNLDSQIPMFNRDKLVFGRAFWSVNVDEAGEPSIMVESPREMVVKVDRKRREISHALKVHYRDGDYIEATSFTKNTTVWLSREKGQWRVTDWNRHDLGRVPIVMSLNRQMTGDWDGRSEMADVIPLADAAARTLTDMQFAVEAAAVPRKFAVGVTRDDFVNANGEPQTAWEAYIGSVWATANEQAKIGQLPGADLTGFIDVVTHYGNLAAAVTGYPVSYFGQKSAQPPSADSIRAEEARLVKTVERANGETGKALAWAFDLAERLTTGQWPVGNRTIVEWHDPGTPTFAQRADALQKLAGGMPILSREGAWDELGWTEARMERERQRFADQNEDPVLSGLMSKVEGLG